MAGTQRLVPLPLDFAKFKHTGQIQKTVEKFGRFFRSSRELKFI